jgi:membrane-associated protease RseP (regulator of RpoE activity)
VPSQGYPPVPYASNLNGVSGSLLAARAQHPRWWLHVLLLAATFVTTSVMGAAFANGFRTNRPVDIVEGLYAYGDLLHDPGILVTGLPFSVTLLLILLAHEMGHYLACTYYRVDATPPFFIPFPAPIGTFGAFIRIRAPMYSRRTLFDVAVAGPLAGFFFVLPALSIGLAYSKVIPGIAEQGDLVFGVPLIQRILESIVFPGVPSRDIYLHPIARAAWVGVLATALNLLPIGQLDGGHILYSFAGKRAGLLSKLLVLLLIPIGLLYSYTWLVWAAFLFFFGMRHPAIYDSTPLGPLRTKLGWLALIIFILCFTVAPIRR